MTSIRPFVLVAVLMVSLAGLAQACPNSKAAAAMGCPASSCGNASTTTAAATADRTRLPQDVGTLTRRMQAHRSGPRPA